MGHLYGGIGLFILIVLMNARFGLVPWIMFAPAGVIGVVVVVWKMPSFLRSHDVSQKRSVSATEAPEAINEWLADAPGKKPINLSMNEKVHEDTLPASKNGKEFTAYGIIGFEETDTSNKYEGEPVRVIWNLDDNELVTYDGEVPDGSNRTDPFFGKRRELRHTVKQPAEDGGEEASTNEIYVNPPEPQTREQRDDGGKR